MGLLSVFTHQKMLTVSLFLDNSAKVIFVLFVLLLLIANIFVSSTIERTDFFSKPFVPGSESPDINSALPELIAVDPSMQFFMDKLMPHVRDSFERLPTAQVLHNISNEMKLGVKETIQVSISKEITEEMLAQLQRESNRKGIVEKGVHYDPRGVEMTLIAEPDEFKIFPISVGKQYVIPDKPTKWSWEITPLKPGNNLIVLSALVDFYLPELEKPLVESVEIFNEKVLVKSDFYHILKQDLRGNWSGIFIFVFIIGLTSRLINSLRAMAEQPRIQQNFAGNVYGAAGNVEHDQNINVYEQKQTLTEVAAEIQSLLKQLEATNPNATEPEQVAYINAVKPDLKQRAIAALKEGGETAIEEFFLENKYLKVAKAAIKGWLQPSG
jgi:hypothetical protein